MAKRKTRRIAHIDHQGIGSVIKEPTPDPKPGQVLLRVRAAALSPGTELGVARQLRAGTLVDPNWSQRVGYQNAGEVIEVGRGVKQFKKGDRVAAFGGGYSYISDFAVVPQNLCCKLPDKVSFVDASYGNVMLTGLHAVRRAQPQFGENMLVVGLGIVGQFAAQFARFAGQYVMGWDTLPMRLKIAKQCGTLAAVNVKRKDAAAESATFTHGYGFDHAIMAIGGEGTEALKTVATVMKCTDDGHQMGSLILVGGMFATIRGGAGFGNMDLRSSARSGAGYHDEAWEHGKRDYEPVFMRWTTRTNLALALDLIARGIVHVKPLTTHKLPIDKFAQAIDMHLDDPGKALGTVFVMD
jgi:threonine dehydrogenase-like Zn-dependent dehydrogenase